MKYLGFYDLNKRRNFSKSEIERIRLKSVFNNRNLSFAVRFLFLQKISCFSKNSSYVRIKNRCLVTKRGQSVYRNFKINRITLREIMRLNLLNGLRKSSW